MATTDADDSAADDHADVPQCNAAAFPVETEEELVWGPLAGQVDGNPQSGLQVDIDRSFGYILTASWGEEPVRAELPVNRGRCCKIDVLDTGFVAISDVVPVGSDPWPELAPPVHYSSDGLTSAIVDVPTRCFMYDGEPRREVPIWISSVDSTESGVVIRESPWIGWSRGFDFNYWSADGDLTNWRRLLAPPPGYD